MDNFAETKKKKGMKKYLEKYLLGFLLFFAYIGAVLFPLLFFLFLISAFASFSAPAIRAINYTMIGSFFLFVSSGTLYFVVKAACLYINMNERMK